MQNGSIMLSGRRRGPDVWEYRWCEPGADGKRKHRRLVVGSVNRFADKAAAFRATSALRRDINLANMRCNAKPITLSQLADHYWGQSIMSNQIRKIARAVGITKKIGWHTFRHTCATLLRASGADIKVVQELLRHASCRVTLDTYTQAVTEQKRAAQNKIAGLVRGLKPQTPRKHPTYRHSRW